MARCKRCGVKTALDDSEINRMVAEVTSMKGVRLADDDVFTHRFNICRSCEKLEYGSTCMSCGCVMQVRARLADGKCPLKLW